ncbi:hypothetical protein BJ878DRAFT_445548 [Calycina marina]|uniref:SWIM-type domain-containing protein n=1 Tax=Calycina marina TaxID=1763456 RepID=A0A9P7YYR0_9HELO|nr:hypothetical protein BJ878DRAFT_445548 [Calycina marina]
MSAPISKSFSKLSIYSDMEAPRGRRGGQPSSKVKEVARPDDEDSGGSSDSSDSETQESDPDQHVLALYKCQQHNNGHRYIFHIADATIAEEGVHIKSFDDGLPSCSCNEVGPCRHVLWLRDQLARAGLDVTGGSQARYYDQIASTGLQVICDDLQWDVGDVTATGKTTWRLEKKLHAAALGPRTRASVGARMNKIRDILATLSDQLPDDYRADIFSNVQSISTDSIVVKNDLGATLSRLLVADDTFLDRFDTLVPADMRASDYFYKMEKKAEWTWQAFDAYILRGTASGVAVHNIFWCARELTDIVESIGTSIKIRQPLSTAAGTAAAKALVTILSQVVVFRNTDVKDNFSPRRPNAESRATLPARNLYQRLIGSSSPDNPPGNAFVLSYLEGLPEAHYFLPELEEVQKRLISVGWGPAPLEYRDRMRSLRSRLSTMRSQAPPLSFPSKRPGPPIDKNPSKRIK